MTDNFSSYSSGLDAPASGAVAVTPDDATDLGEVTRALYVGVAGDIAVVMKSGQEVSFTGVAAGTILPLRIARVKATGTTAGNIVGLV